MKLLLIHLSDLHIKNHNSVLLLNKEKIVDAVKNLEYRLDAAFIIITGDISYEGAEDQLLAGFTFFAEIKDSLNKNLSASDEAKNVPTYIIPIPGNHDCWLPDNDAARNILIQGIINDEKAAYEETVIKQCAQSQKNFFEIRDCYAKEGLSDISPVYYEYNFTFGDECIAFKCLNTAWMSKIYEEQGNIVYPIEKININKNNESLIITLLHHPYNWIKADNARNLKKKIGKISDLILTGHEHDSTCTKTTSTEGEKNTYIEGGVLQENNSVSSSNFNALVIDTTNKKQKYINLLWSNDHYIPSDKSVFQEDSKAFAWHEYQVNTLRLQEQFAVNEPFLNFLEDTGASFSDKYDGMKLSDIFVCPDLKSVPTVSHKNTTTVSGDDLCGFLKEHFHILIVGDYQSGKTALCKNLFLTLSKMGEIPLFINGSEPIKGNHDSYANSIFAKQYDDQLLETYRQTDRTKRAVIIDNYHNIQLSSHKKKELISWLCDFAGRIILVADELEISLHDIAHPDNISDGRICFEYYSIQQFGHVRRDILIKKWLARKINPDENTIEFAKRIENTSKILNTLIGRNYVPAYPIYIVSVLFAADAATPVDLGASTHAYFYELIIKIVIAKGRTGLEYDIAASYLSFIAYKMFKKRATQLPEDEYKRIHEEFENKYSIDRPFERMKKQLLDQHILVEHDGEYKFKHGFMYYYFVASFLRDNLSKDDSVKGDIKNICDALYVEEYANILLFLAHLCKDVFIINELIDKSGQIFSGLPPAHLDDDIDFLGNMNDTIENIEIEEKDKETVRREILKEKDRDEKDDEESNHKHNHPVTEEEFKKNPLLQLASSLKTIEILGQLLKNFPASIDADEKKKITNSCYLIGLRILTFTFRILQKNEKELLQDFTNIIHEKNPDLNINEVKQRAKESVLWLSQLFAFGLIKRVSYAIGTPDLFLTYDKILQDMPFPSVQLIDCSLYIDQANHFPDAKIIALSESLKKKWFPYEILRKLVIHHLYLFDVPRDKKQRICDKLSINYKYFQITNPKRKMIESKSK